MKSSIEIEIIYFWFSWFSMNFSTLAEDDDDDDDEKVIPKTAFGGRGQKKVS